MGLAEWCRCGTGLTSDNEICGRCGRCGRGWLPPFSTDIAAAWEVVKLLQSKKDYFSLTLVSGPEFLLRPPCNHRGFWDCAISLADVKPPNLVMAQSQADAPMAICLAVLMAVENVRCYEAAP